VLGAAMAESTISYSFTASPKFFEDLGVATPEEVQLTLNKALCLFAWTQHEIARGRIIASMDENTRRYTEFTFKDKDG
jgi:hypothetical protein